MYNIYTYVYLCVYISCNNVGRYTKHCTKK